jgi:hypothetical protein
LGDMPQSGRGNLAETGSNTSVAGCRGLAHTGQSSLDKDLERVERCAVVIDDIGKTSGFAIRYFEYPPETRNGRMRSLRKRR